jgi:chromatin assembly factor 1 subunit B
MVFAIATFNSVIIYNTVSELPLFMVSGIHYAALTDMTWFASSLLAISS